jgi:hypothetical protein
LAEGTFDQVVDWNKMDIDWAGRGLDRGLRGIAFHAEMTYIAASDEILAFDGAFTIVARYPNAYLRHCHEIDVDGHLLWATSTGFDSLLALDLALGEFTHGLCLRETPTRRLVRRFHARGPLTPRFFDPRREGGPQPGDSLHLNSVVAREGVLYCSGTRMRSLLRIANGRVSHCARLPRHTHNTRLYRKGVLMNVTNRDVVRHSDLHGRILEEWPVQTFERRRLLHAQIPRDHARPGFARGLCTTPGGNLLVGSSPATVSMYEHGSRRPTQSINITLDVRNAIHGLEIYPY